MLSILADIGITNVLIRRVQGKEDVTTFSFLFSFFSFFDRVLL